MYDVPKEYRAAIRSPTRNDRMAGKLTLTDGSTIELTDSAVISGSVSVDNQCVSGQELAFGSVYMGQASLQLRTALSSAAFYDAALQIDYEIQLADGSWYTLPVGRYTVAEAERSAAVVSLTGYDNMLKLERKFSGSAILGDAYAMLTQIAGTCGVELAQYLYDDAVDTSNKSIVVDWYYKKPLPGGGTALHLVKFTGRDLLYASENDPAMAGGFYPHGQYPVVFDVLYPEAGTPCGFGMIAVSKDPQQYIDRLSGNLLEMSMKASTPRFWVKKGCGVNAQEFLDWSKPLVEVEGSIDDERLRQISLYNLDGQWVNMLQLKINELKETSNSRDVTQGSVSGGVTAASAIAALQEAGSKSSRDTLRASYRAFERVVELVIELIRAYYTETRPFRVAAPGAQGYTFCTYSNAGLRARVVGTDADGMALQRAPAFDVSVHAQKESPYATASQNELARQLYQLGVFNPAFAQQAVPMLEMMQFPGRDKVLEAVRGSIAPQQPETPEADAGTDALQKAQEEKNRIITANAR